MEPLLSRAALAERAASLGVAIGRDYQDSPRPPILVGVLKGSTFFLADLVRAMPIDVAVDFMSISTYAEMGGASGVVRIVKDLEEQVAGRDVVLVEDIVDTGLTLTYLRKQILGRAPRSLRTVTLLDKSARRIVPVPVEYTGFEIGDAFVLGYGLDFHSIYRNLPDIYEVPDLPALVRDPASLVPLLFATS
ncbi:MAG: hypoxanthine phosphoribosyltransferase [Actinomycetota bacterium]|nr:hypoxanthine phosphoribosyltransferase [Actinomycetota bacterium]